MRSIRRTDIKNIKGAFARRTGVKLEESSHGIYAKRITATVAMVLLMFAITASAYAGASFSSLAGDELSLYAVYEGEGVVSIYVENRSDQRLEFESRLKLMLWSAGQEIEPTGDGEVMFSGNEIEARSSGRMTVDLSQAYDIAMLEQPLTDDSYYFILTNNNFAFGQDWMCTVYFAQPIITPQEEPTVISSSILTEDDITVGVMDELLPYFDDYTLDPVERNQKVWEYFEECRQLLGQVEGNIVPPQDAPLVIDGPKPGVVFDSTAPLETQHWLTGLHRRMLDGYNIPVGASEDDCALVLSAYVPQRKGETDGGVDIPLVYIFTYAADDIQSPQDMAFIRGRLLTFGEMEQYKVYADDMYVCYDVTDLFYSDLRDYVESMVAQRTDIYFDEQVWERVRNIYNYYRDKEVLAGRFYYNMPVE